jgi:MSHA biogenesis protein MshO
MTFPLNFIRKRHGGFTLVEAIVVMAITGILAGIMVLFIRRPVQSYVDSAARADMGEIAELALRRMARELHTALPNSIRVSTVGNLSLLEFIPTKAGGLYLAVEDNAGPPHVPLSFTDAGARSFEIVGSVPAAPYAIVPGDSIVVYNLGTGLQDADAYAASNRATVTGVNVAAVTNATVIGFDDPNQANNNPFANAAVAGRVPNTSPGHRFNVATTPVTFACVNDAATGKGTLTRFWAYGYSPGQVDPSTLANFSSALIASNVLGCQFSVTATANQHTGLIGMAIVLARSTTGSNAMETVTLAHQVHVDNTP